MTRDFPTLPMMRDHSGGTGSEKVSRFGSIVVYLSLESWQPRGVTRTLVYLVLAVQIGEISFVRSVNILLDTGEFVLLRDLQSACY